MFRPRPTKLGHIVLKVVDVHRSVQFYTEIVGLEISDWIDDRMVFLRAGTDHHDLALLQMSPDEIARNDDGVIRLEHFSYHLETLEELEKTADMLEACGIEIDRGIGRHGPGNNLFLVFRDPDDNNVEFYADMIRIDEANPHKPKIWAGSELETFDQWGLTKFRVLPPKRIRDILASSKKDESD